MTNAQKEYCIHNLAVAVVNSLKEKMPDKKDPELMAMFCKSKTYKLLSDVSTRLWAEGPDYILDMYLNE